MPTAAREGQSLTPRPLRKTVTPLKGELLSGWLTRLAVTNHYEVDALLTHNGVNTRHAAMLDFDVEADATTAEKISIAARVIAETVQSLSFGAMTQSEARMTARVACQPCPDGSRRGITLKQWRQEGRLIAGFAAPGSFQSSPGLTATRSPKSWYVVPEAGQRCLQAL